MPIIAPDSSDQTLYFKLRDANTGQPLTGLTITDLDIVYVRDRAAAVKADATALVAVDSAHGDNKAFEVSATLAPGLYRVDFPDAAFADGVDRVTLMVVSATTTPEVMDVELASGGGLTAQETRDAMKLAPSVGAADADSIDDQLADLSTDVAAIPLVTPDAAGTAAGLHATTDALIGGLVIPDAAGTAAGLHAATDALINGLVVPDAAGVAAGLHAATDALINGLVVPDAAGTALGIVGAAGANLTALGDTRLGNLDAKVSDVKAVTDKVDDMLENI